MTVVNTADANVLTEREAVTDYLAGDWPEIVDAAGHPDLEIAAVDLDRVQELLDGNYRRELTAYLEYVTDRPVQVHFAWPHEIAERRRITGWLSAVELWPHDEAPDLELWDQACDDALAEAIAAAVAEGDRHE